MEGDEESLVSSSLFLLLDIVCVAARLPASRLLLWECRVRRRVRAREAC